MELVKQPPTMKLPKQWFTGDVIWTPPGEQHWHGADPDQFMTHLALWETDDVSWLEHVTDAEYAAPRVTTR